MKRDKILAVDDDLLNLEILKELLEEDYFLSTAENGLDALEMAERIRPGLILLDIMMPGMDGYEVCRQVRSREILKYTKVLLVSAKAMTSERLKGYEAGADDYIIKPFDHEELSAKIRVSPSPLDGGNERDQDAIPDPTRPRDSDAANADPRVDGDPGGGGSNQPPQPI